MLVKEVKTIARRVGLKIGRLPAGRLRLLCLIAEIMKRDFGRKIID